MGISICCVFACFENSQTSYLLHVCYRFAPSCTAAAEVGVHLSFVRKRVKTDRPMACVRGSSVKNVHRHNARDTMEPMTGYPVLTVAIILCKYDDFPSRVRHAYLIRRHYDDRSDRLTSFGTPA